MSYVAALAVSDVAAQLTEALLPVVADYPPADLPAVDVELTLWHALERAIRTMPEAEPAAYLTDAAYRALLPLHPVGSFVELELRLMRRMRGLAEAV